MLGALMTEPKPQVWFDGGAALLPGQGVVLDRRTRMAYDDRHVFINGEAFVAGGRDARLMRLLADHRRLSASDVSRLGEDALALLNDWLDAGWVTPLFAAVLMPISAMTVFFSSLAGTARLRAALREMRR